MKKLKTYGKTKEKYSKLKEYTQNSRDILKTQGKNSSFSAFLKSCYVKKRAKGEACSRYRKTVVSVANNPSRTDQTR